MGRLIGRRIEIVDEETGTVQQLRFGDTPLTRGTERLLEESEALGLSKSEAHALLYYALFIENPVEGVARSDMPADALRGFRRLAARGWAEVGSARVHLFNRPEIHRIFGTAETAGRAECRRSPQPRKRCARLKSDGTCRIRNPKRGNL